MSETIHKFSDFNRSVWDLRHADLVGVTFVIYSYTLIDGAFGEYALADCLIDGEKKTVMIGSGVLVEQLKELPQDAFPLEVTIQKPGRYYTFA